jgi:hypothetical protein
MPNRSAAVLLSLIVKYIHAGYIIHSDSWLVYATSPNFPVNSPYIHATVNFTKKFVDPATFASTNNVEEYER